MAILSAQVAIEALGVATASIESTDPMDVYDPVEVVNPATDTVIATLMVTKCVENDGGLTYQVTAQDPMSALTQGSVLLPSSGMGVLDVLSTLIETDYGQLFETVLTTAAEYAAQDTGDDEEVEPDEVDWNNLVRTAERLLNVVMTWQADAVYRMAAGTDRGALSNSVVLSPAVSIDTERYANRVIVRCAGEWRTDPGAESTATETIRGASMTVKRYGEQIREITLNSGGVYHHETFDYDEDNRMVEHVAEVVTTLSNGTKFKTTTTRAWTITDEVNYSYAESTITQRMGYWEEDYVNQRKTEITTEVAEGSVEVTNKGYGWNFGSSAWEPLITDDSMTLLRGFPAQPGVNEYGVLETYKYWYDTDRSEWVYDLVKSEAVSSAPSAPGFTTVLPLTKHSINLCSVADDAAAQAALGLKTATLSVECLNDDTEGMDYIDAIAANELARRGRCRMLTCEVPLTTAEAWKIGDTFSWNGITWTIEKMTHTVDSMTTAITAAGSASIAALKKALIAAYDEDGKAIIGIIRKENRAYDNVQVATIVSQLDYETWVIRLSDGRKKIAKLPWGSGKLWAPGSVVTLLKESG